MRAGSHYEANHFGLLYRVLCIGGKGTPRAVHTCLTPPSPYQPYSIYTLYTLRVVSLTVSYYTNT